MHCTGFVQVFTNKLYRKYDIIPIKTPKVSNVIPTITAFFFLFFSDSVSGRILSCCLYLFSIDCPIDNPIATPIAGPIPINPGLSVTMLRGTPINEKMTMPMLIQIPKK